MRRMTKERIAVEVIYIRAPGGTRDRIERLRRRERASDFMRRLLLAALEREEQELGDASNSPIRRAR